MLNYIAALRQSVRPAPSTINVWAASQFARILNHYLPTQTKTHAEEKDTPSQQVLFQS